MEEGRSENLNGNGKDQKIRVEKFDLYYGDFHALEDIETSIKKNAVTAVIGPSGCGKSTLLRSINRMNDTVRGVSTRGQILLDGENIYGPDVDVTWLRSKVGMVFQRPVVFPLSVFDNVACAPRVQGITDSAMLSDIVEQSLKAVDLWDDLKFRLEQPALSLSLGNQQKLCIARTISIKPDVILFDEPCSALDPVATLRIEELMWALREEYTIIIVTHNMQQAARASDYTVFMLDGQLIEVGPTGKIFTKPADVRTEKYITGKLV